MIRGMERAGVVQPGKGQAHFVLPVPKGVLRKGGEGTFIWIGNDRVKSSDFKQKEGGFRKDVGNKFFTHRVVKH